MVESFEPVGVLGWRARFWHFSSQASFSAAASAGVIGAGRCVTFFAHAP